MVVAAGSNHTALVTCEREHQSEQKVAPRNSVGNRRNLLLGFLIVLILIIPFTAGFEAGGVRMDEGSLLVYPELISHGAIPYRDFETFYGPANIYVLTAAYSLFGTDVTVERSVGLLYQALILALVFACVSRWGVWVAVGCSLVATSLLLTIKIIALAWFGGVACLLAGIWLLAEAKFQARHFVAGLTIGCALLYRVDLIPATLISLLPILWLTPASPRRKFVIGTAIGLLPLALLMCYVSPRSLLDNLFLYPVLYTSPARHVPMSDVEPYIRALFFTHLLAAALNIIAGIILARGNNHARCRLLLSLALLGAALTTQAAQRLDFPHLISAVFLSIGTLPLSLLVLINRYRESRFRPIYATLAIVAVFAVLQTVLPGLLTLLGEQYLAAFVESGDEVNLARNAGRSFPRSSKEEAIDLTRMLNWLERESNSGERLFVGPADLRRTSWCDTFIYHLVPKLRPSTYFLEMNPLSANRPGSRLAADVSSSNWLVLDRDIDSWKESNRSLEFQSDAPNQVVREKFQLVNKFGPYLIFRRRI